MSNIIGFCVQKIIRMFFKFLITKGLIILWSQVRILPGPILKSQFMSGFFNVKFSVHKSFVKNHLLLNVYIWV